MTAKPKRKKQLKIYQLQELAVLERELHRRKAQKGMLAFTTFTKQDYLINWHHLVMCRYLNAFVQKKIKRLMFFMPPQTGKSELTSRRLPAFIHGHHPTQHIVFGTYGADLATRMNRDVQRIIDSQEYRDVFPETRLNSTNVRTASGSEMRNSELFEIVGHKGSYRSAGRGQGISGMPAHWLLIDDLLKDQKEADSPVIRDAAWDWLNGAAMSRLWKDGSVLYTTTRWHEDEPAGRLLDLAKKNPNAEQWTVVKFPAIRETLENDEDPRLIGEALWPWKQSEKELTEIRARSGESMWNALYQQEPSSKAGNNIKREWWKRLEMMPTHFDEMIIVADPTMDDTDQADNCAFQCWGRIGANKYLIDSVARKMEFTDACDEFEAFCAKHPKAFVKLVEKKANGAAIISTFKDKIPGIIPFNPDEFGGKTQRVKATAPNVRAGNCYVLNEKYDQETAEFIDECARFPKGKHDDRVDCFAMAMLYWQNEAIGEFGKDTARDIGSATLVNDDLGEY